MGGHEVIDGQVRVLVTGSRTWRDRDALYDALDQIADRFAGSEIVLVHGAAKQGVDRLAAEWAETRQAVTPEPHPVTEADYDAHGKGAPLLRNTRMVQSGADLCLTFIQECPCPRRAKPHGTHGSVDCATKAARAGIPVRHVRPAMEAAR
jgi:hypothetical protein